MVERKYPRYKVSIQADLSIPGTPVSIGHVYVADISTGGLAFETKILLSINSEVTIKLNIEKQVCPFTGIIMYREQRGPLFIYGIKFLKMGLLKKMELSRHIKWINKHITNLK